MVLIKKMRVVTWTGDGWALISSVKMRAATWTGDDIPRTQAVLRASAREPDNGSAHSASLPFFHLSYVFHFFRLFLYFSVCFLFFSHF